MLIALAFVFALSFIAPFAHRQGKMLFPLLAAVGTAGVFGYLLTFVRGVLSGNPALISYDWAGALDVSLIFYPDGLGLFFALLVSFFGILILVYAGEYMKHTAGANRFFAFLIFFMGAMLGLVLSANLISLFIFWELTSISSYLLIGFKHRDKASRESARQALLVTAGGGLALLAGLILLGIAGESYQITELLQRAESIQNHRFFPAIIVLTLLGAFTKSAQFPFHFWLPSAMKAPTPVSAFLHSATMVKAGIYLVFRFHPIFAGDAMWQTALLVVGGFTAVMAAFVSFQADDLKRVLAFTTISALGMIFFGIGIGSPVAIGASCVFLLAHALYKGALFMLAGALDHTTGTRQLSDLSELRIKTPFTAIATLLACLSMSGLIPFFGFIGKELLYKSAWKTTNGSLILTAILVLGSVFFVAVCAKILYRVFLKSPSETSQHFRHEALGMYAPPLLLGILALGFGLLGEKFLQPFLQTTAQAIGGTSLSLDLSLWHGFNNIFLLSLGTLLAGFGLFLVEKPYHHLTQKIPFSLAALPETLYEKGIKGLVKGATFITRAVQNGFLRNYISVYITVFCGLMFYFLFSSGMMEEVSPDFGWERWEIYETVVLLLVSVTLFFIFKTNSRLAVIATIGITGYAMALGYTFFSAPDVAITQFLAETLGVILLAVILPKLPRLHVSDMAVKLKYVFVSVVFGGLMAYITLLSMSHQNQSRVKDYFIENSIPKGKGENVVNVILVDFRALDTLGEISVLVITMIGIIAFMGKFKADK